MNAKKLKIFILSIPLAVMALAYSPAITGTAYGASAFDGPPPKGVSQKEWERCKHFYDRFKIDPATVTQNREAEFSGNFVEGLPVICSGQQLLLKVINYLLMFSASVAVLFIILGGYWYLTAAGNDEQAEKGRKTLMNSVIGLIVIIMSFAIVRIVVNLLGKPVENNTTASATNSGTSSTTTIPGGGNNNTPGGSDPRQQAVAGLSSTVSIPSTVKADQKMTISSIVGIQGTHRETNEGYLSELCDGAAATNCPVKVYVNGQEVGQEAYNRNTSSYSASVEVPGPFTAGEKLSVSVKINNTEVASGQVTVEPAANVSPRGGEDDSAKVQAAARSSFTLVLSQDKKSVKVNISALSSDKLTMCGITSFSRLNEGTIEVFVNGASVGQDNAAANTLDIEFPERITETQYISVNICDNTIGGGTKEIRP